MNRREFTASLAALVAAPALPLGLPASVAAAPAVPPGAYAWAQLIARAQNRCSAEMLAQTLNLEPGTARVLFNDMVHPVAGVCATIDIRLCYNHTRPPKLGTRTFP